MENNSPIVMLVAIVAIAGVFAVTDGFAGAASFRASTPRDSAIQIGAEISDKAVGSTIGYECFNLEPGNTDYCCSKRCESFCKQERYGDELAQSQCFNTCKNACEGRLKELI